MTAPGREEPPLGELEAEVRAVIETLHGITERARARGRRRGSLLAWQAVEYLAAGNRDLFSAAAALAYDEADEAAPAWREKHSVNCYFCGVEFDERTGVPADRWNGNDGGTACPSCATARAATP